MRHLAVVLLVVGMIWLGFWQLRRLDEKRSIKATVEARQELPVGDVEDIVPEDAAPGDAAVEKVAHRSVTATGTYVDDDTFVVENRSFNGASGGWVLTPLELDDGTAVVVNRGFLGFDREGVIDPPPAPTGKVVVDGLLLETEERGRFGATDPVEGELDVLARVDLARVTQQVDYDVLPAYVQRVSSRPDEVTALVMTPEGNRCRGEH